jgi:hypothetical protein
MNEIAEFVVGQLYTNDQIRFSLSVENLGGIRPALDARGNLRHIAILTTASETGRVLSENPYRDRVEGDVLTYTAQGREGDQHLRGRNKRLLEQYAMPVPIFGFINVGKQTYRFLGMLELLRHYQETQADTARALRRVWLFEFRVHPTPAIIPIDEALAVTAAILHESRSRNGWTPEEAAAGSELAPPVDDSLVGLSELEVIRSRLLNLTASGFEVFLQSVMLKSGFRDVTVTGKTGDGGIDLNGFVEDGNEFFAGTHTQVQAKRWRHLVGNGEINHFRGALSSTAKGVFIATSHFTPAALKEARHPSKPCIAVIDGLRLASLVKKLAISVP